MYDQTAVFNTGESCTANHIKSTSFIDPETIFQIKLVLKVCSRKISWLWMGYFGESLMKILPVLCHYVVQNIFKTFFIRWEMGMWIHWKEEVRAHGRMGTLVRNNFPSGQPKKMSKGPVNHTKKMSRIQPASQCDTHIYIHVHNLFVWCNRNIPELLIFFTYSATPHLWASFPFFHGAAPAATTGQRARWAGGMLLAGMCQW